jgi:hypothetical protein
MGEASREFKKGIDGHKDDDAKGDTEAKPSA